MLLASPVPADPPPYLPPRAHTPHALTTLCQGRAHITDRPPECQEELRAVPECTSAPASLSHTGWSWAMHPWSTPAEHLFGLEASPCGTPVFTTPPPNSKARAPCHKCTQALPTHRVTCQVPGTLESWQGPEGHNWLCDIWEEP